jgi:hypothetical protein
MKKNLGRKTTKRDRLIVQTLNSIIGNREEDDLVDGENMVRIIREEKQYKIPCKYLSWIKLSNILASVMIRRLIATRSKEWDVKERDILSVLNMGKIAIQWFLSDSPLFIVTQDIISKFVESKVLDNNPDFAREILEKTEVFYPNLILLFPSNCPELKIGEENFIDHCIVGFDSITDEGFSSPCITYNTITGRGGMGSIDLSLTKKFIFPKEESLVAVDYNYFKIVMQSLLLIASKPELVITSDQIKSFNYETSGQGFQKPKNGDKVLYPRVLNLSYAEKKIRSDDNRIQRQGNYSPKSPHWRLGYEVNKPVGKMKGVPREQWERKKIKVAPYFVLGGDDKDDSTEGLSSIGSEFKKTIDNNQEF